MTQNTLWQPSDISTNEAGAAGGEQDSPKRRGRIPQSAWPQILERYRAGATLSAIAREFECTPSAISYIVRKAEAGGTGAEGAPTDAPAETNNAAAAPEQPAAPAAAPPARPAPRRSPEAPRPAAEAKQPEAKVADAKLSEAKPAEAKVGEAKVTETMPTEAPKPAEAPKTRLELKREEPRPAPTQTPEPAPAAAAPAPAAEQPAAPRPAGARPEPTPPVDEVEARLRETARGCLAAYRTWRQQPGQGSIQTLSDAVHELRKVLARIEIDMSASRRDEQVARPIPIPAHRAARRSP